MVRYARMVLATDAVDSGLDRVSKWKRDEARGGVGRILQVLAQGRIGIAAVVLDDVDRQ